MRGAKLKSVYGRPLSKMVGHTGPPPKDLLEKFGASMVTCVVSEARSDFEKYGLKKKRGDPTTIPDSELFFKSFGYVVNGSSVSLTSTWAGIDSLINGRGPFKMRWLTQARGVDVVPMKDDTGVVLFRTTPVRISDAWVHPGIRKHDFIRRGIERAKRDAVGSIIDDAVKNLLEGDILL